MKAEVQTTKSFVKSHDRSFLQSKRLINIFLHFTFLFVLYVILSKYYAFVYKPDMIAEYYYFFFFKAVGLVLVAALHIFYITLYYNKFPLFEKMKANSLAWPWEENPQEFKKMLPDLIKTYLLNLMVLAGICYSVIIRVFPVRFDIESAPSFFEFWIGIWASFLIEDYVFYWVHRFLHHPKLYWIHKKHHKMYNTIHASCIYTHWIEYIFGVVVPLFSGLMVFQTKFHIITLVGISLFRIVETHESHGGYEFTYSIFQIFPGMVDTAYHNYHHLKNIGNFGTYWVFWDSLFGTNKNYFKKVNTSSKA
jgi:sterol desaturase/sphingolipid hydroxylase (fatty acid hydroxylase superfamily)